MDLKEVLHELGLSQGEIDVYLALLKLGSAPVSKIKEETEYHRTVIYDFIEKLINKGLVSYVIENNIRLHKAAHPSKLLDLLKEKETKVNSIMSELIALSEFEQEDVAVEVYRGREGVKTVFNKIIRNKGEMLALGVDESRFDKVMGSYMKNFFVREKDAGCSERLLTYIGAPFIYHAENITYRYVPKEYFNPTSTFIFGDNVGILIWQPLMIIFVTSKELADAYRKQFEMMWAVSKKTNKLKK